MADLLPTPSEQHVLESFRLAGRVAIVTGGSRGIGLAVAVAIAEAGADVAIVYNTARDADTTAVWLSYTHSVRCKAYQCNISDATAVDAMVDRVVADFGRLDIMVANAGVAHDYPAETTTPERLAQTMRVNFDGSLWCARKATQLWQATGQYGNIIFTTSMSASIVNVPDKQAVYNASKAALVHLAKSLSIEWLGTCRVNCISPGYIATEMLDSIPADTQKTWIDLTPAKRMGLAHELKGAYVFCASDASSFMTGANIIIDGGYTVV
ncbi:hypothetical protein HMPREF1624_07710 [Sporothrix schenckii ATCC 58251]|uniref:Ketoreductase domain-containing protein n=1 Tax=Sporothrix schenckii (strain ATCC 58251 / de Perez 2211183) TaxID=1391915 RepID=U7PN49_SPOS1|nr:hypothetical protein HMPREF1624_07710 [Sporothrix schenckii ATCC 58251]